MSGGVQQSLFFLSLPDLKKLVCVTLTLQAAGEELRSKQIKTCRELVLLYSDVLACPALESFSTITVVMAIQFFQKGILQAFGQRQRLQLGSPQCVFPGVLQCCLSYSLVTRLAPSWNKAGLYLVSGQDFLTESGKLNAVSMKLSTRDSQLCISMEANSVRLPPATLEDFDLPHSVLRTFCSDLDSILDPSSTGGTLWCHVLPSMKKGQIITISRQLPRDGPFRTYRDLQNHWDSLYGYRLPDLAEEEVVYCSVYFRLVGERLFTYPLSCIRLQPVSRCPGVDLQGVLGSFLADIRNRVQSVCGLPAHLTSKPCYPTTILSTAASQQVLSSKQVNLTTSCTIRPILTQLPAPPTPPQTVRPSFGSTPPAKIPHSQQDQGNLGNGCGFGSGLTQSQGSLRVGEWPSSSSSSFSRVCLSHSSGFQSAPSLSSSSSFHTLFRPASSAPSLFPPPSQTLKNPTPKLVPIFSNKHPSLHVNVALLRVQKQREQQSAGGEERRRMTLPSFGKNRPTAYPAPSFHSFPIPPPPVVPCFKRHPKPLSSTPPQPSAHAKVKHISSLSPASKVKPGLILTPKSKSHLKTMVKFSLDTKAADSSPKTAKPPPAGAAEPPQSLPSTDGSSSKKRVRFESKAKNSRAVIRDVDVEEMARNNQLSRLNSATLLSWLRGRGVLVSAKHKKEELMLKVMGFLAEG
ncbi:uncharacterized protein C18orf63 homolog isoform X2 [Echeneis naucrates]|uniref:uncharacterized protein C18orf63 homolog isoform X2 n=1 Tax=Echeneis naucrates TaxID=173247 RepID=UPI00111464C9|nr:uncharacterized protein C18orf63 homolog isoform X2 [Echeneis naucrates]